VSTYERGGGQFEPEHRPAAGAGMIVSGRFDECQEDSRERRARAKVKRGPLRGLAGMVCMHCMALRVVPA
jgi:hypothetical protein